jgi:hypothetical protein
MLSNGVDERFASAHRTDQIRPTSEEKHPVLSGSCSGSVGPRARQFGASDLHLRLVGAGADAAAAVRGSGRSPGGVRDDRMRLRTRLADAREEVVVERTGAGWAGRTGAVGSHFVGETLLVTLWEVRAGTDVSAFA